MTEHGTVKWFNDAEGFGFIVREGGGEAFVSARDIATQGFKTLSEGDKVAYDVVEGRKGPEAKNVVKIA